MSADISARIAEVRQLRNELPALHATRMSELNSRQVNTATGLPRLPDTSDIDAKFLIVFDIAEDALNELATLSAQIIGQTSTNNQS